VSRLARARARSSAASAGRARASGSRGTSGRPAAGGPRGRSGGISRVRRSRQKANCRSSSWPASRRSRRTNSAACGATPRSFRPVALASPPSRARSPRERAHASRCGPSLRAEPDRGGVEIGEIPQDEGETRSRRPCGAPTRAGCARSSSVRRAEADERTLAIERFVGDFGETGDLGRNPAEILDQIASNGHRSAGSVRREERIRAKRGVAPDERARGRGAPVIERPSSAARAIV
jgi:hypothetical protein